MYAHVPGLKVVMPTTPQDAKGLLIAAIRDPNPVIYIDDRWLYDLTGEVNIVPYEFPIGKGTVPVEGTDVTVVALGYMVREAIRASERLGSEGISVEVIDPRTVKPLDIELVLESVRKTRRLVVADPAWPFAGVSAEICCQVVERGFSFHDKAPVRVTQPDTPIPASTSLENAFYQSSDSVVSAVRRLLD